MPQGFNVGDKPSIPQPVDLKDTDPERQKLYGKLTEMTEEEIDTSEEKGHAIPPVEEEVPAAKKATEEDKKEFLRSVMGGSRYVKTYVLFGSIKAVFADRTTEITEDLFRRLSESTLNQEGKEIFFDRLLLAAQLTQLGKDSYVGADVDENIKRILKLSKPLYQAVMAACRDFEAHVAYLTDHAQDADFWKPGGADSSSTPAGPGS